MLCLIFHFPHSVDGCADGNSGSFHSDESLDKIVVKAKNSGSVLQKGMTATIVATAYVYSTSNYADFFYAADASNPSWEYIGTVNPPTGGVIADLTMDYTVPVGSETQAVRVQFRLSGGSSTTDPCLSGSYNDRDDVVFQVPPLEVTASYSSNFGAPYCSSIATSCDTGSLVVGRGAMGDDEPNYPNT